MVAKKDCKTVQSDLLRVSRGLKGWSRAGHRLILEAPTALAPRIDEMTMADTLLPEFDQEMATTRRVLERVPDANPDWKPHPKSFSIAHLAQLVSWLPGWVGQTLTSRELDLATGGGYSNQKTESLLKTFDDNVRMSREAIAAAKDEEYDVPWSLTMRGNVLFTAPRRVVVRQHISHLSHHRGQLTVYLRLLDVPVPSVYGPTADEKWGS
jgi:uncharacterized damage-inducible protein DinB